MDGLQDEVAEQKHYDLINLMLHSTKKKIPRHLEDGSTEYDLAINPESLYWKTHIVGSDQFAELVYKLKEFERMADQCYYNMSSPRAAAMAAEIKGIVESTRCCIDAKSSESVRGKDVVTSTLLDRINKSNVEKTLHVDGAQSSIFARMFGRDESGQEQ